MIDEKDTDKLSYDILADLNPGLLRAIEAALKAGASAAAMADYLKQSYPAGTVVDLAIGAAYYLESLNARPK